MGIFRTGLIKDTLIFQAAKSKGHTLLQPFRASEGPLTPLPSAFPLAGQPAFLWIFPLSSLLPPWSSELRYHLSVGHHIPLCLQGPHKVKPSRTELLCPSLSSMFHPLFLLSVMCHQLCTKVLKPGTCGLTGGTQCT